jgi:dipeptidyl aminopeptidase/acylaminoacyl peptidase
MAMRVPNRVRSVVVVALCALVVAAAASAQSTSQGDPKNFSIDPWHIHVPKPVANPATSVVERIPGSNVSAEIIFVEMADGTYSPIAMMKPQGNGPFPLVLIAHMNGGQGTQWLREWLHYGNWTPEQLLAAGYAVAWMRYRAEVNNTYGPAMRETSRQGRQLFNRGPYEYDDAISIAKYVKTLPYVNADRVGYLGLSHGGEMLFKIASEYNGLRCGIAVEPASGEYLAAGPRPPGSGPQPPETRMDVTEAMLLSEKEAYRKRLDMKVAMARINAIQMPILVMGRTSDDNMPAFRLSYELAREAGKQVEWKQYLHPEHGFIFVRRNEKGQYAPDTVQTEIVKDTLAYFDRCLKG